MTDKAAIKAFYVRMRTTHDSVVLTFETDIANYEEVSKALGTPGVKGSEVAIARMNSIPALSSDGEASNSAFPSGGGEEGSAPPSPKPKGGALARWAGIVCNQAAFRKFLVDKFGGAACDLPLDDMLRNLCAISSRAELDHNPEAARKFRDLMASYGAWRREG